MDTSPSVSLLFLYFYGTVYLTLPPTIFRPIYLSYNPSLCLPENLYFLFPSLSVTLSI